MTFFLCSVAPVSVGLFLLVPVLTAQTPASMCTPLKTLNDSLSHRRRYMVRGWWLVCKLVYYLYNVVCFRDHLESLSTSTEVNDLLQFPAWLLKKPCNKAITGDNDKRERWINSCINIQFCRDIPLLTLPISWYTCDRQFWKRNSSKFWTNSYSYTSCTIMQLHCVFLPDKFPHTF